ncbi:sulfatase-like hydrolase/transferase [Enterobacter soli]|uniref:sulfatase-like hydrolase/transferase n=1 Tax=Enterobacter soli TaxID=885040 RepID=UPI003ED9FDBE
MKKNVVFIHLESLNQAIYSHRQWFPCLNSLVPHSLRLNNFISSATSSFMAVSDLLHGDDNVLEHNVNFEVGLTPNRKAPAMFDQLRQAGYRTAGLGYPINWANFDEIWSESDKFKWFSTANEMVHNAESIISDRSQPFALYIWNLSSHLCYQDSYKSAGENSFVRWQRGYESMDSTVGDILRLLMNYKQMENTVLVIFGDHGDDFWNHGLNGGFAHAIEPYTSLVHTPAFIYNSHHKARDINHLVSMIDLQKTVFDMLDLPVMTEKTPTTWSALSGERKYCYSRNLFAAQSGDSPHTPLRKGYSITSELFHLLYVKGEYKMYAWQADSANQFNLLDYMKNVKGKITIDYERLGIGRSAGAHPHIQNFLSPGCEEIIMTAYEEMSKLLQDYIARKDSLL